MYVSVVGQLLLKVETLPANITSVWHFMLVDHKVLLQFLLRLVVAMTKLTLKQMTQFMLLERFRGAVHLGTTIARMLVFLNVALQSLEASERFGTNGTHMRPLFSVHSLLVTIQMIHAMKVLPTLVARDVN